MEATSLCRMACVVITIMTMILDVSSDLLTMLRSSGPTVGHDYGAFSQPPRKNIPLVSEKVHKSAWAPTGLHLELLQCN